VAVVGDECAEPDGGFQIHGEGFQIAVVHADDFGAGFNASSSSVSS
jgi:hypothetical protein